MPEAAPIRVRDPRAVLSAPNERRFAHVPEQERIRARLARCSVSWGVRSALVLMGLAACGGSVAPSGSADGSVEGPAPETEAGAPDVSVHPVPEAGPDADLPVDAGPKVACVSPDGTAMSRSYGMLDGTLVTVVPVDGPKACNGDGGHLHLQVAAGGRIYDVAVNTDALYEERPSSLGEGFSPGFRRASLDYPTIGVHSADFVRPAEPSGRSLLATLERTTQVRVYLTGYGPSGGHLVHRQGGRPSEDGAVVLDPPASGPAPTIYFRFAQDAF